MDNPTVHDAPDRDDMLPTGRDRLWLVTTVAILGACAGGLIAVLLTLTHLPAGS